MDNSIRRILNIMEDNFGMSDISDASMQFMPGDPPDSGTPVDDDNGMSAPPEALDLAKQLINIAGSPELAREIIDKIAEVDDILGDVVDDNNIISHFADNISDEPDLPNNIASFGSLF